MKRIMLVVALILCSVMAQAQTFSTAGPATPMPMADAAIRAFVIPATQTLTLLDTAQKIGTVPAGCHVVWLCASGPVNFGSASVSSGLGYGGVPIPTGTAVKLNLRQDDPAPAIYVINQTAGATATVRLMFAK